MTAQSALKQGAELAVITSAPQSTLGKIQTPDVVIESATKFSASDVSVQPLGSLFERTLLILSDAAAMNMNRILSWIGASAETWELTKAYLTIVSFGGPFVLIANCYSNVIRAEGQSNQAMMGQLLGNFLNVVLDPLMILRFRWNIAGAAIATVIGNVVGAGYYILYFLRGKSALSVSIRDFSIRDGVCSGVLSIGVPASLGSLMMSASQIIMNSLMAGYGAFRNWRGNESDDDYGHGLHGIRAGRSTASGLFIFPRCFC